MLSVTHKQIPVRDAIRVKCDGNTSLFTGIFKKQFKPQPTVNVLLFPVKCRMVMCAAVMLYLYLTISVYVYTRPAFMLWCVNVAGYHLIE